LTARVDFSLSRTIVAAIGTASYAFSSNGSTDVPYVDLLLFKPFSTFSSSQLPSYSFGDFECQSCDQPRNSLSHVSLSSRRVPRWPGETKLILVCFSFLDQRSFKTIL
jgi:hypothetical protein